MRTEGIRGRLRRATRELAGTARADELRGAERRAVGSMEGELAAALTAARILFPDFAFLAPGGVLTVRRNRTGVERLRIELPAGNCLHLQSVRIVADNVDDVAALTRVEASSWHGDLAERFDRDRLFAWDAPDGTAVHTGPDEPAWIEFRFARPLDVTEISLRNVDERAADRMRGVRLTTFGADGSGSILYDAGLRREELTRILTKSARLSGADQPMPALLPVAAKAMAGQYQAARKDFDAIGGLSEERRREFRELITQIVLEERSLEWTIHGPQRCFRFWPQAEKVRYLEDAIAIVNDLRGLTPNVCFGFGSVLSVVRDGDFIPHDDDLDIIIGFEQEEAADLPAGHRLVERWLRERGYEVRGKYTAHRQVSRDGRKHVDVFVGLFEGDTISWYPGKRGVLTREIMYPTSEGSLFGIVCPLPRSPLIYLERLYGPGWRHPDPGFKHEWDRRTYADLVRREPVTQAGDDAQLR